MASDTGSFDFIIVGGGTAGLVLASRIAETPALGRVLVVEAGEDQTQDSRVNVPAFWPTLLSTGSDWSFKTVAQVSRHFLGPHHIRSSFWAMPPDSNFRPLTDP